MIGAQMRAWLVATAVLTALLAACGGDDATSDSGQGAVGGDTSTSSAVLDAGDGPSGTVTVDGTAYEVQGRTSAFQDGAMVDLGGDFQFCTYSDGGDDGHVTILVAITETDDFFVSFGRADGLGPSADYPRGNSAHTVDAELVGGRAIGTADFSPDGPLIQFDISCAR
jgi:hypothetical protein